MHDPVWWIFFKRTLDKSVIIVTSLSLVSRAQKSSFKTVLYDTSWSVSLVSWKHRILSTSNEIPISKSYIFCPLEEKNHSGEEENYFTPDPSIFLVSPDASLEAVWFINCDFNRELDKQKISRRNVSEAFPIKMLFLKSKAITVQSLYQRHYCRRIW